MYHQPPKGGRGTSNSDDSRQTWHEMWTDLKTLFWFQWWISWSSFSCFGNNSAVITFQKQTDTLSILKKLRHCQTVTIKSKAIFAQIFLRFIYRMPLTMLEKNITFYKCLGKYTAFSKLYFSKLYYSKLYFSKLYSFQLYFPKLHPAYPSQVPQLTWLWVGRTKVI